MKNILVIDDDSVSRELIQRIVEYKDNINFFEASNGLEGLNIIDNNKIDLIFLDLIMPKMNGIEFLNKIKPKNLNIPIIVLTTDDTKLEEAKKVGATDIIIKPINATLILEKINNYI